MSNLTNKTEAAVQAGIEKAEAAGLSAYLRVLGEHILAEADKLETQEEGEDNRPIEVGDTVRVLANPHYSSYFGPAPNVSISEGDVLEVIEVGDDNLVVGPRRIYVLPEYVERVSE